ncbi:hypothetical protein, conserved [Plasmodium vivax]|uniref:Uncharacterized protein n=1 Tax=Plasmodium vivax (strain Salvador I) TaxID=126793 RepID=A5K3G5_PLAVS|nr:hypothetical protein, conserved [Plasmodium vivax]EDL46069.1 hypothetical protein, conserved [Plasmodium vivax]|eukprot:XP_001615796.1 hypothetical protein [Plasmodium vivax Sal-1]
MLGLILKNALQRSRYHIAARLNRPHVRVPQFSSQNNSLLAIEKDQFYVNPLRKLTCIGCGEFLQTTDERKSGFVPFSVYEKYSNGRIKFYTKVKGEEVASVPDGVKVDVNNFPSFRVKTKIILCRRCYRLQHYKCADTQCEVDTKRIENIIKCRTQLQEGVKRRGKKGGTQKGGQSTTQTEQEEHASRGKSPEGTPVEGTPPEGTPVEGTPPEGTPVEGTPPEGTPVEGAPPLDGDSPAQMSNPTEASNIKNEATILLEHLSRGRKHRRGVSPHRREAQKGEAAEGGGPNGRFAPIEEEKRESSVTDDAGREVDSQMEDTEVASGQRHYHDPSYRIDRRSVNIYEKRDILKKRNDMKRLDAEKMEVSTAKYVEGDRNEVMNNLIKKMKRKSLVLYLIDITNIENTILPELYIGCKNKDINIIWLVNKVDCLPKMANLERVKIWFRNLVRQIKNAHINDLIFISALKFFNFNVLEERMKFHVDLEKGTDIYIVGCVNVGKSTFVNSFLKYINYKHLGDIYSRRKKGGVTTSNIPYTTLNYNTFQLKKNIKIIDTMGIPTKYQYSSILYKDIDLNSISFHKRIQPLTYKLKENASLILGSLCYINLVYGSFTLLTLYISNRVTIHMCRSEKVESFLERKKCSFLYPPHVKADFELLKPFVKHTVKVVGKDFESIDDIVIGDLCWFSVTGRGIKVFEIYAPKNLKIYRRPSMISDAVRHTQVDVFKCKSYRGRTAKVLRKKKKLIEELDRQNPGRRQQMKGLTLQGEPSAVPGGAAVSTPVAPLVGDPREVESIAHHL